MRDTNRIVSTVKAVVRPQDLKGGVTAVHFGDGRIGFLSNADPKTPAYGEILEQLRHIEDPAYVEVNEQNFITRLLIPIVVKVKRLTRLATGDLKVELEPSHARHLLRMSDPDAAQLAEALQEAQAQNQWVVITETLDDHIIIDVRPPPSPGPPGPRWPAVAEMLPPEKPVPIPPRLKPVTADRATELFNFVGKKSCEPTTVPHPCIPFLYPDDGCWARAHEMCRLIGGLGEQAGKLWMYGNLEVRTPNHPQCHVCWIWHVAPVLSVSNAHAPDLWVVDPALFDRPVTDSQWKLVQGHNKAIIVQTDASVYLRNESAWYRRDESFSKTTKTLAQYRLKLKLRSASAVGPPPYRCRRTASGGGDVGQVCA